MGPNAGSRNEACVQTAIRIEASEALPWLSTQRVELPGYHNLAVLLQGDRNYMQVPWVKTSAAECRGSEVGIQSAIAIEPADATTRLSGQACKIAAHHNLPIRLHRQSIHRQAVAWRDHRGTRSWIERGVHRAIGIESAN